MPTIKWIHQVAKKPMLQDVFMAIPITPMFPKKYVRSENFLYIYKYRTISDWFLMGLESYDTK